MKIGQFFEVATKPENRNHQVNGKQNNWLGPWALENFSAPLKDPGFPRVSEGPPAGKNANIKDLCIV